MWIRLLGLFVFLTIDVTRSADNLADVTSAINRLTWDLLQTISGEEKGNIFISPLSISIALAMTYAGADGNTADQISRWLIDGDDQCILPTYGSLLTVLQNKSNENVTLNMANKMYVMEGVKIIPEFQEIVEQTFRAKAEPVDFGNGITTSNKINEWISSTTNGMIKEMVTPNLFDARTFLVLVNGIYFEGRWLVPFDTSSSYRDVFHGKEGMSNVTYMRQFGHFYYLHVESLHSEVLILPYANQDFEMILILPNGDNNLESTIDKLKEFSFTQLLERAEQEKAGLSSGFVVIPRFKLESKLKLNAPLEKLGMSDMFNSISANFSKVTNEDDLYVKHAIHKAVIQVNETGSVAAAATVIIDAVKTYGFYFHANRPFLFAIVEQTSKTVIFVGKVELPKEE